jgi:tetratricopeptide (TPR) repeat protein
MDEKEQALEHYQESIRLEPGNTGFCKGLADFYYVKLGNVDEAMTLYNKILTTDPNDCETLMILGNLAVVENEFDKARDFYQRILEIEPWNDEAAMFVEKLDHRLQQGAGIQAPEAQYQKSQELFQSGNIEGAIKELETMLTIQPESALAHNDLGVLYYRCNCKDESLVHYEEAMRLEPDNPVYQKNLADFYFVEMGRIEDALKIYLNVLTEDPTDIETLMAAGHICKVLGSPEKAKVFYSRVLDIEPWNLEASEILNQVNPEQLPDNNEGLKNLI